MRKTIFALIAAGLFAPLALTACDRTVSETTKTTTDNQGNVSKDTVKKTETPSGDVTVTHEKESVINK